jgi:hypothetical protein
MIIVVFFTNISFVFMELERGTTEVAKGFHDLECGGHAAALESGAMGTALKITAS